jgi:hypothetical protein
MRPIAPGSYDVPRVLVRGWIHPVRVMRPTSGLPSVENRGAAAAPGREIPMRSSFDKLISWTGLLLALMLLVAGALLTWAYVFINNEVESQLGIQGITMPEGESLESLPDADRAALEGYAGSAMDTGPEAKAYADHYILVHMNAASGNRTYTEVSGEYQAMSDAQKASPAGQELAGLRETLFQGNTLRGLLLYGYAFATMGTIAGIAAIGAYLGAVTLLVLGLLGIRHARRATAEERAAAPMSSATAAPRTPPAAPPKPGPQPA